ncbi:MAG: phosphoribosylglycinamide formyltransferase [Actinomycetota bacterium]
MGARIAVLASGSGTNLQALLDDPEVGPQIVLTVSDRPEANALDRARAGGVPAFVLEPRAYESREAHDQALLELLEGERIDAVLFAGYMRILTPVVVKPFEGRWLNVHPSLLPAFPGAHAVRDALAWGAKVTGVTIHFVDSEVDHGPIVFQEAVTMLPDDDEASLLERLHEVEHRLYPRAARLLAEGRLKIDGRIVHVLDEAEP